MSASREVVIVSGVRTAIGDYGGSLKDFPLVDLAASVVAEAIKRADVDASKIGQVVMGNVIHTDPRDMYLSRYAAVKGGIPIETPAYTLNRLCGSGLQAIVCAAQSILCGDTDVALGGGAESMSRSQYWLPSMRWGQRMNDGQVIDAMVGALSDPFDSCHMGVTAENVASRWEISREDQDQLAVESHQRAHRATEEGYFKEQILTISIKQRKQMISFEKDEHIRSDATTESMAKLKTVFKEDGSVTAGNASGLNDAASAVILMERSEAEKEGKGTMTCRITGAESGDQRVASQQAFQDAKSETKVCLITMAAAEGVNLQLAKAVIFYDTPWSAGDYLQIIGRMIRIGSIHDKVFSYHICAPKTIDDRVMKTLKNKMNLIEAVLGKRLKEDGEEDEVLEVGQSELNDIFDGLLEDARDIIKV